MDIGLIEVSERDTLQVVASYDLLRRVMGDGIVEDKKSFLATISADADAEVVPRVVATAPGGSLEAVIVGAYLRKINAGVVLYAAVAESSRGRGVYSSLRRALVARLDLDAASHPPSRNGSSPASSGIDCLVTELDQRDRLYDRYVRREGAYVAPCEYWQPPVQGLRARRLRLVVKQMAEQGVPTRKRLEKIIREIYLRVYRVTEPDRDPYFRRVVESLGLSPA